MQGKNTKECGIKTHTYIYPLFFPLCPGRGRRCRQPRPGIARHGTTPKRGTVAQAEKLREKWGLKAADFPPSGVRLGCASRGLRGLRPERCPPELTALFLLSSRAVPGQPGSPLHVPPGTLGISRAGSQDFPLMPTGKEGCFSFLLSFRTEDVI